MLKNKNSEQKASVDTLKKHDILWKGVQVRLQAGFLASDPGDLNVGEIARAPFAGTSDFGNEHFGPIGSDLQAPIEMDSLSDSDVLIQGDMSSGTPVDILPFKGLGLVGPGDSESAVFKSLWLRLFGLEDRSLFLAGGF